MEIHEDIPEAYQRPALAALDWINASSGSDFSLTGVVDTSGDPDGDAPFDLGLVLCDGEICNREQVRITPRNGDYEFAFVDDAPPLIPPLLDPPPGIRSEWIDKKLAEHEFILLLYYRGLW